MVSLQKKPYLPGCAVRENRRLLRFYALARHRLVPLDRPPDLPPPATRPGPAVSAASLYFSRLPGATRFHMLRLVAAAAAASAAAAAYTEAALLTGLQQVRAPLWRAARSNRGSA